MIKKLKTLLLSLGVTGAFALAPATVLAQPAPPAGGGADINSNLCTGASLNVSAPGDCAPGGAAEQSVNNIITTVINIFSIVVGVVAVIMIIIGGLRYIISGGDSSNVSNAKNTILYAIVGLIVVALAQIIVRFVLSRVTSP